MDAAGAGDVVGGDHAGSQDAGCGARDIHDGAFDADVGLAAIDDEGDGMAEGGGDMLGGGWGEGIGRVCAGRGQGEPAFADDGLHDGMEGPANADGGSAGGDDVGDAFAARDDEGEGAGPEGAGEACGEWGPFAGTGEGEVGAGDMDDDGVVGGALLDGEDLADGVGIPCIGGEAIDGLGGEGDDMTAAQQAGGLGDGLLEERGGVDGEDFGRHGARMGQGWGGRETRNRWRLEGMGDKEIGRAHV